jgi:3-deoxy-D-manno-octulosonate 8-phosphate phosphatase (KDO 8-P phosphatase)
MPTLGSRVLQARLRRVRLVLMDVDGVLTDGRIFHLVDTKGALVEFKGIHSQDSIGLSWLAQSGLLTGVISGRMSEGVAERLKLLKMRFVYQHRLDKKPVFDEICRDAGADPREALYIGDDLPDLPVLRAAGVGVAVANARPEVRRAAGWVTRRAGGDGAVREVAEALLKSQGLWDRVLAKFR